MVGITQEQFDKETKGRTVNTINSTDTAVIKFSRQADDTYIRVINGQDKPDTYVKVDPKKDGGKTPQQVVQKAELLEKMADFQVKLKAKPQPQKQVENKDQLAKTKALADSQAADRLKGIYQTRNPNGMSML